jgi:hypothetical protein
VRALLVACAALVLCSAATASILTWYNEGSATAATNVWAEYTAQVAAPVQLRVRVTGPSDTNGYAQSLCKFSDGEEKWGKKEWFGTPSFYPIPIASTPLGTTLQVCWAYAQSDSALGVHGVEIQALLP